MLKVKVKKLVEHAQIPEYAKAGDAGLDLVAVDCYKNHNDNYVEYGTGISVSIPSGYVGLIFPRSSISKTSHLLCNSVGVVDSGYTGEIMVRFKYDEDREDREYEVGDRIAQLIVLPYPQVKFEEVTELEKTERGSSGFGSSG